MGASGYVPYHELHRYIVPPQICNMIYAFDQSPREKKFLNHFHKQLNMYQFS